MKIFITVGTTQFDSMIKAVDDFAQQSKSNNFTFQIATGRYIPKNGYSFSFTQDIDDYYNNSDLIITHAGAGSIYHLLKISKKIIIIPNLERADKHQLDIAKYMDENNFALVCYKLNDLSKMINESKSFSPHPFKKESFFKVDDIANYIQSS